MALRRGAALALGLGLALAMAAVPADAAGRWPGPAAMPAQAAPDRAWQDEIIYMILTDRFHNGDPANDGNASPKVMEGYHGGDFQGIIDKLDYVRDLGVTAIWISPVVDNAPGGYHGYWPRDFYAINDRFGDMAKLQELVRAAQARGLRVMVDVVLNHTGSNHPWQSDPETADWYHPKTRMGNDQRSLEIGWLSDLPDLNHEHPAVRAYLIEWARWLIRETGVDGFRLDAARHVPRSFWTEFSTAVKAEFPGFFLLGEVSSGDYNYLAGYQRSGLDGVTDFRFYDAVGQALRRPGKSLVSLGGPGRDSSVMPHPELRATFVDNHDLPRFLPRTADARGPDRLRLALAYMLTSPGVPVIYYGTEVGLAGSSTPDNRRDMPWDEFPRPDLLEATRALTALRRELAPLRRGDWQLLAQEGGGIAYARSLAGETVIVALNAGAEPWPARVPAERVKLPAGTALTDRLQAGGAAARVTAEGLALTVPPLAAQVWVVDTATAPDAAPPAPVPAEPAGAAAAGAAKAPAPAGAAGAAAAPAGAGWPVYALGTVFGIAIGAAGWAWARRRSRP